MKSLHDQLQPLFARVAALVADEVMPLARQMAKDEILSLISGIEHKTIRFDPVVARDVTIPRAIARRGKAAEVAMRERAATAKPKLKAKATPSAASVKAAQALASAPRGCSNCGKPGHYAKSCGREVAAPKPKPAKKPKADAEDSGAPVLEKVPGGYVLDVKGWFEPRHHVVPFDSGAVGSQHSPETPESPIAARVQRQTRGSYLADEPRVLSLAAATAMLAADRERQGDAGGFVARADREPSLVGAVQGTDMRETCSVHGWVGRHRFEQDRHALCSEAPADAVPCRSCDGVKVVSAGFCRWCGGTGIDRPDQDELEVEHADAPHVDGDMVHAENPTPTAYVNGVRVRSKRERPRAHTVAIKSITRAELRAEARSLDALNTTDPIDATRPRTRAECPTERPCPFVGCSKHLYLDVDPETGSIKFNFPELQPEDMRHSCSLDAAELGPHTLEAVGEKTNLTRERVRQLEVRGLLKLKTVPELKAARR